LVNRGIPFSKKKPEKNPKDAEALKKLPMEVWLYQFWLSEKIF
jgi:hypothetical protein